MVVDRFIRELVALEADCSREILVAATLTCAIEERGTALQSITLDNGSKFLGRASEILAIRQGEQIDYWNLLLRSLRSML
jgi:hypothetical protein